MNILNIRVESITFKIFISHTFFAIAKLRIRRNIRKIPKFRKKKRESKSKSGGRNKRAQQYKKERAKKIASGKKFSSESTNMEGSNNRIDEKEKDPNPSLDNTKDNDDGTEKNEDESVGTILDITTSQCGELEDVGNESTMSESESDESVEKSKSDEIN